MPKPVYILCAESGSIDSQTNLVSHYEVIEQFQLTPIPESARNSGQPILIPQLRVRTTAVWMQESGDSRDDQFEGEVVFYVPPEGKEYVLQKATFSFGASKLYRFVLTTHIPPFTGPGLFRALARIRRPGQEEWLCQQEYPIFVELLPPAAVGLEVG